MTNVQGTGNDSFEERWQNLKVGVMKQSDGGIEKDKNVLRIIFSRGAEPATSGRIFR